MHHLGLTRSAHCADHILQTPDTFVRAPLPGMRHATAITHIAPARGARFTQYTVEFEANGYLPHCTSQRFIYVLDGEVQAGDELLTPGGFLYTPADAIVSLETAAPARVAVIEKPYEPLPGIAPPKSVSGNENVVAAEPLDGDPALEVRRLLPTDSSFDFAINTMSYQPGSSLSLVEMHVMEHGLLMLAGGGIYRLNDRWYPVEAGDFIWMAPYCPQWFAAIGQQPAKYLLYKDWNR